MNTNRDDFSEKTKRLLADRVGWQCSFPNCEQTTLGPSKAEPTKRINNGMAAHICAASSNGPRYDLKMTKEERISPDNGIWMCRHHGTLIDSDFNNYSVEQLKEWKALAEQKAYDNLTYPQTLKNTDKKGYSEQDKRAFQRLNKTLPYEIITAIKSNPFGNFVEDAVISPFNELTNYADDPLYFFEDAELIRLRNKLIKEAEIFLRHFSAHSAGRNGGYDYINIKEFKRYNPNTDISYWIKYSDDTSILASNFCDTALQLRAKQQKI